mmetsp:Transcript_25123/g.50072  ORF Transcript_25123/g.50072 Transcript_25123/m.50072 type:complete len:190 (-) Transcript_25123:49-618(-)|eukprot:CAMPEP_0182454082 /NCGR_PEP_ID=MMETSP1319-20130603/866_1 /TAXON_ID=172717 /ORGANISM="Bolidomonas pacifica, Strain RCC208" /LENGTH=189 /DNA_ID=CAMNT_0024652055 /DNA_START=162 /DNA_END=731 /DNA_ORIENTATION=-
MASHPTCHFNTLPPSLFVTISSFLSLPDALHFSVTSKTAVPSMSSSPVALASTDHTWGYHTRLEGTSQLHDAERYSPYLWQNLPLASLATIHSVRITGKWRDQGWGNKKGMISVTKNGTPAPNDYSKWHPNVVCGLEPAPHDETSFTLTFTPDASATTYDIYCRVGGGGGHSLQVHSVSAVAYCHDLET